MEISAKSVECFKSFRVKNPISTLSGKKPVMKTTSHWYLPMQKHEAWLKEWIEEGVLDGKQHHDPKHGARKYWVSANHGLMVVCKSVL